MIKFLRVTDSESSECVDGDIRLVGSQSLYQGRVEVCVESQWARVCGNDWDHNDAAVVCHQLVSRARLSYVPKRGRRSLVKAVLCACVYDTCMDSATNVNETNTVYVIATGSV